MENPVKLSNYDANGAQDLCRGEEQHLPGLKLAWASPTVTGREPRHKVNQSLHEGFQWDMDFFESLMMQN